MYRNTLWNLLGEGVPMAAALLSIPQLVTAIGLERFGFLTLIWALLGYLAVLDFGLVRALVQAVAERRGASDAPPSAGLVGPALGVMALLGVVLAIVVAAAAGPLATYFLHASPAFSREIGASLQIAAIIAPIALVSAGLRGVLEAAQEFRAANLVRMTVGMLNYLSPLVVLAFSNSLVWVLAVIAAGRAAGLLAYLWLCLRLIPDLLHPSRYHPQSLRPLFSMGAWMMGNNLLGPVLLYADRAVLASLAPAALIAFYTTPFEIITRMLFIPAALAGVLFPVAASLFRQAPQRLSVALDTGGHLMLGAFLALQAAAALGGNMALHLWLGPAFAEQSGPILSVLCLGLLFNAVAHIPYALLHGIGRVDITTKVQLAELPFYLGVLWLLVNAFGPLGAAAAWTLRTGGNLALLLALLPRYAPDTRRTTVTVGAACGLAGAVCCLGLVVSGDAGSLIQTATLLTGLAIVAHRLLTRPTRGFQSGDL